MNSATGAAPRNRGELILSVSLPRLAQSRDKIARWFDRFNPEDPRGNSDALDEIPRYEGLATLAAMPPDVRAREIHASKLPEDQAKALLEAVQPLGDARDPRSPAHALIRMMPSAADWNAGFDALSAPEGGLRPSEPSAGGPVAARRSIPSEVIDSIALAFVSFLHPALAVPAAWLHAFLSKYVDDAESEIERLKDAGLLEPEKDGEDLHVANPDLRAGIWTHPEAAGPQGAIVLDLISEFGASRAEESKNASARPDFLREIPYLAALAIRLKELGRVAQGARIANLASFALQARAEFPEKEKLLQPFAESGELEKQDPEQYSAVLSNLAGSRLETGRIEEAESLLRRARRILVRMKAPDPSALAATDSNLASVRRIQGRFAEAQSLLERAIALEEKHYGGDHPQLAIRYHNLAQVLLDRAVMEETSGLIDQAENRLRAASHIAEVHHPPEHLHRMVIERALDRLPGIRRLLSGGGT